MNITKIGYESGRDPQELIGREIYVHDDFDDDPVKCTIVLIEQEEDLGFAYLKAEDESFNTEYEPKLGYNIHSLGILNQVFE